LTKQERLTLEEYRAKYGEPSFKKQRPRQHRKAKQRLALAMTTMVGELERKLGLDGIEYEHQFAKERGRKYRLDLALPALKIGMEVHGGAFVKRKGGGIGGAHHTIEGRARDMAKGNLAAVMGWIVIEVSPNDVADGTAFDWIAEAVAFRTGDT
jgi:hypothetical protein